ncbi:hypothetical protein CFIICLFH_3829 [Methylobacterium goesingense]|nr:hypothetical protein CFIICLFH_3829 [Methylobacterium goesingense]
MPPVPEPVVSWVFVAVSVPSGVPMALALTLCLSIRSTSLKTIVPLSDRAVPGEPCSVTAPESLAEPITGASLVPVRVTATVCATEPSCPSPIVIVKISTLVWPLARYSTLAASTA